MNVSLPLSKVKTLGKESGQDLYKGSYINNFYQCQVYNSAPLTVVAIEVINWKFYVDFLGTMAQKVFIQQ